MDFNQPLALSLVICTYNRAGDLRKLLEQLFEQIKKHNSSDLNVKDLMEIIIVDNNSTDYTQDLVLGLIAARTSWQPDIKYVLEQKQGSSFARNRGIKEASANLIVFLDDDVLLDKSWLLNVLTIAKAMPKGYVAGAKVVPDWKMTIPPWLNLKAPFEIIQSCFPAHDYGDKIQTYPFEIGDLLEQTIIQDENPILDPELQEKPFFKKLESLRNRFKRKVQNPISACFLASRDIFEKHGGFREDLGIIGDNRGACEDTELFWRLIASEVKVIYQPAITVHHPIPKERMTKHFVLKWYELIGFTLEYMKSKSLMHLSPGANLKTSSKFKLLAKKVILWILYLGSMFTFDPVKVFWFKAQLAKVSGEERFKRCNS